MGQEEAQSAMQDSMSDIPTWAKATIGILGALVTILLALGLNVGGLVEQNTQIDYEKYQAEIGLEQSALDGIIKANQQQITQVSELVISVQALTDANQDLQKENQSLRLTVENLTAKVGELEIEILELTRACAGF